MIQLFRKEYNEKEELIKVEFKITDIDANTFKKFIKDAEGYIELDGKIKQEELEKVLYKSKSFFKKKPLFIKKENPSKDDIIITTYKDMVKEDKV